MSYNQPGPYGGQPQQPQYDPYSGGYRHPGPYEQQQAPQYDPYASPQPDPYGGQQGQPGYGYPQQPPPPQQDYGYPPQDPSYGYPQQPPPPQQDYGYPPQDPSYGYPQQPAAQQPDYGYPPEQPPATTPPPYPHQDQDPYGQQQAGWDAPEKGGNNGKTIGIAVAAVFLLVIVGSVVYFSGDSGSSGGYTLATPAEVMGGEFTKNKAETDKMPKSQSGDDAGISDATSVSAVYTNDKAQLSFGGAYGDVSDPAAAVDQIIASGPFKDTKTTTQKPAGFDGDVMKCGELDMSMFKTPFCVWGDSSTAALVMYSPTAKAATGGKISTPSVSEWAGTTAKFRKDVRVKD